MKQMTAMRQQILQASTITFLTGAGVSTASGIPDYRSLKGVYQGHEQPEYLLSASCLRREPEKFYQFVKQLYHPNAQPNSIHRAMVELADQRMVHIVSQNIDDLHQKAGAQHVVNFHGSLYDLTCLGCGETIPYEAYLQSDLHQNCGGRIRPNIVLYEEGFTDEVLTQAIAAVAQAEVIVIVGTTFQVHPFCDLLAYRHPKATVFVVNQTPIYLKEAVAYYQGDATEFFTQLLE